MTAGAASLALQRALHAALTGNAALMALLTGVHDAVPAGARFPYATIGDDIVTDWSTKTASGREHRLRVTLWDDARGATRLKQAMALVETAVAALPGTAEGFALTGVHLLRAQVSRDADGPGRATIEFRARTVGG